MSISKIFIPNFVCVIQMKDTKHIRQDFHSVTLVMLTSDLIPRFCVCGAYLQLIKKILLLDPFLWGNSLRYCDIVWYCDLNLDLASRITLSAAYLLYYLS